MRINELKINHISNPLGFGIEKPTVSWIVDETQAKKQDYAQVIIALDHDFTDIVSDSEKRQDISSLAYRPSISLMPRTIYYVKVTVWGDNGDIAEGITTFETAKIAEPWQSHWLNPSAELEDHHALMKKAFDLPSPVSKARAYVCGLGLYQMEINGRRVGNEQLTPYCNAYDKWIQYQTYDITGYLQSGTNVVGASLGNGWYKGRFGLEEGSLNRFGSRFALLMEIHITLTDGKTIVITTDRSWKCHRSPVLDSSIYDGEIYDANLEIQDWSTNPDTTGWTNVEIDNEIGFERLQARKSLPVIIKETLKPILIHTPKGEVILDMGQNMVGWVKFNVHQPKGTHIKLSYGEVLQEGCFYRDNLRSAKAEYHYTADGTPGIAEPHFTFYGFRYVKVEGIDNINPDDFTGCVVYSDIKTTGTIETSNPLVNRLIQNVFWGQKGNFLDVPTDCPQRDERMGWTGDAQVFSGTALFNMDSYAFYSKYLYDLYQEQKSLDGSVPHVVPMMGLPWNASSAWGDAATIIPWNCYLFSGDITILEQQFDSMKAWVDYIKRCDDQSGGKRLWTTGSHYGDWLALDSEMPGSVSGRTAIDYISSAYYAYSTDLVVKAAKVLGRKDDEDRYQRLSNEIHAAIQDEYFTKTGRLAIDTQTAHVMAIFMDLVSSEHKSRIINDLNELLNKNKNYLKTGFVGTSYLCRVLSENGLNKTAYDLLLNEEYPSWLYEVHLGATTIWERWNSLNPDGSISDTGMNSLNHYAYGSLAEWMYRNMCGINPIEDCPGFKIARIAPMPDKRLQYAKAEVYTASGKYVSAWKFNSDGTLTIDIEIPFDCSAEIILPKNEKGILKLEAGKYSYTYGIAN